MSLARLWLLLLFENATLYFAEESNPLLDHYPLQTFIDDTLIRSRGLKYRSLVSTDNFATMATMDRHAPQQSVYPRSHVGFDSITSQIERKLLKRGFQFNVICVGK
jgi:hypothetical protein